MITCTLNGKKYTVDFISGRAMREMGEAAKTYADMLRAAKNAENGVMTEENEIDLREVIDVMARWFCLVFRDQFTVDELYDGYPADRLMHDMALTLMSVQTQTTGVLDDFPTKAAMPQTTGKED